MYRSMRGATKRSERVFCVYERCLVIKKSPWSFGRYVLNFSSISFIPFDLSPAERGVDGCNGGQPVVALAYRPCAGARGLFLHLWHGFLLRVCAYWTLKKGFPIALFIGFVILAAQRGSFSATCALTASVILVVGIMGNSIA
jgi:hypothetical protein